MVNMLQRSINDLKVKLPSQSRLYTELNMPFQYSKLQKVSIVFWTFMTIFALSCLVSHLIDDIATFQSYPAQSESDIFHNDDQKWPTIKVCSMKALDFNSVNVMSNVILGTNVAPSTPELEQWKDKFEKFQLNSEKFVKSYVRENGNNTETRSAVDGIYSLQGLLGNFDEETVKLASAKDFVIGCKMGGKKCDKVTGQFDRKYGMCYSIVVDIIERGLDEQSLELLMFTGTSIGPDVLDMSPFGLKSGGVDLGSDGVKVIVEDENSDSQPQEFDLPGSYRVEMKMKRIVTKRLTPPYGDCSPVESGKNCQEMCRESAIRFQCGCVPEYKRDTGHFDYCMKLPSVVNLCDLTNSSLSRECQQITQEWQAKLHCAERAPSIIDNSYCICSRPCEHSKYDVTLAPYQLTAVPQAIAKYWESLANETKEEIRSVHLNFDMKKMITKVKINLDSMTIQTMYIPAMTLADLLVGIYPYFMIAILVSANFIYAICSGRRKMTY